MSTDYDRAKFISSYLGEAFLGGYLEKAISSSKLSSFVNMDDVMRSSDDLLKVADDVKNTIQR